MDRSTSGESRQIVTVRLFAGMAEAVGARSLQLDWQGGTVAELRRRIAGDSPAAGGLLHRSAVALGEVYANDDDEVPPGAEVAIIPPVSGG